MMTDMVVQKKRHTQSEDRIITFKLRQFSVTLPSFDNQRLVGHAARRTIGKAELVRKIIQEWLDQHEPELQHYWQELSVQTGLPISEVKLKVLDEFKQYARRGRSLGSSNEVEP
ncbi:MAG: hypothetical protein JO235_11775 [Chroococcidiopsidaceae cyanobacterium CP_BM_RX_35]|nr:hypothetical protein [Chroococcidiopsidaceae cyanobacterium CP_BM_RX_35]